MTTTNRDFGLECMEFMDRYFVDHRDPVLESRAMNAMRFLAISDKRLPGEPAGWAAGIIYASANRHRQACGVPGLLNSEFEKFFGVSMTTIRKRAAKVMQLLDS